MKKLFQEYKSKVTNMNILLALVYKPSIKSIIQESFIIEIVICHFFESLKEIYFSNNNHNYIRISLSAYQGDPDAIDYSASKGAIVSFTRSLSLSLASQGIRVNAVSPGPIWTPLIPSSLPPEQLATFGDHVPMKRAGQPFEVAPAYVFLASDDASYISGHILQVNGGEIVGS